MRKTLITAIIAANGDGQADTVELFGTLLFWLLGSPVESYILDSSLNGKER
jgi:hypothetical protein